VTKPSATEGNATSVPLGGLFAPEPEPKFCWICEQIRVAPMVCDVRCMEQDYPQETSGG
jgi:hypothetical protein